MNERRRIPFNFISNRQILKNIFLIKQTHFKTQLNHAVSINDYDPFELTKL